MLDSTTISGNVLAKLPFVKFIKMVRFNKKFSQGIAAKCQLMNNKFEYYNVLTGEPIQQKYIEEQ